MTTNILLALILSQVLIITTPINVVLCYFLTGRPDLVKIMDRVRDAMRRGDGL